jgi:MOSC domain-containing protein YiiM
VVVAVVGVGVLDVPVRKRELRVVVAAAAPSSAAGSLDGTSADPGQGEGGPAVKGASDRVLRRSHAPALCFEFDSSRDDDRTVRIGAAASPCPPGVRAMPHVRSVNLAHPRANPAERGVSRTGMDKRPVAHPVRVRAPGSGIGGLGSGLVGDDVVNRHHHGGDDQAVYAYSRENLDGWGHDLGRDFTDGQFGENLTTVGVDLEAALIGERWRIGVGGTLLEVSLPRIPCATFASWLDERNWVRRFTERALSGTYFRVLEPGEVRAGDPITVERRPDHDLTVGECFRALTLEADLLPRLLDVEALASVAREVARKRTAPTPDAQRA